MELEWSTAKLGQGLSFRMSLGSKWHEKEIAQIGKKGWEKDAPYVT